MKTKVLISFVVTAKLICVLFLHMQNLVFSQRGYYNINIKFTNLLLISLCHKEILLVESRAQYDSPINNNFHMQVTFLSCG